MTRYHRFDEEAAYRDSFRGVKWIDSLPYMEGPRGMIPVTLDAVNRYHRRYDDACRQGYHDLDGVLQGIIEDAYWQAVKVIDGLKADGYGHLISDINLADEGDDMPPPPEELSLV